MRLKVPAKERSAGVFACEFARRPAARSKSVLAARRGENSQPRTAALRGPAALNGSQLANIGRRLRRESKSEGRSRAHFAIHGHAAAMQFHDGFHNRQAKTGPFGMTGAGGVHAVKPIKNLGQMLRRDNS